MLLLLMSLLFCLFIVVVLGGGAGGGGGAVTVVVLLALLLLLPRLLLFGVSWFREPLFGFGSKRLKYSIKHYRNQQKISFKLVHILFRVLIPFSIDPYYFHLL